MGDRKFCGFPGFSLPRVFFFFCLFFSEKIQYAFSAPNFRNGDVLGSFSNDGGGWSCSGLYKYVRLLRCLICLAGSAAASAVDSVRSSTKYVSV